MTVLIVSSNEDPASTNIKKGLLQQTNWDEIKKIFKNPVYQHQKMKNIYMVTINEKTIIHENIEQEVKNQLNIEPTQAIYISRHRSKSKKPTLTTHPIGNYGEAKFGGKKNTLCLSAPRLMTQLLKTMNKNAEEDKLPHQLCYEVTHHGPYMSIPTLFAEVGSSLEEWKKQKPADTVARSIIELLQKYNYEHELPTDIPVSIGIGGGHYAPRFTDVALNKKAAFGHMIPTYHIKSSKMHKQMIQEAIKKTPNASGAYIHKKSMKKSQVTKFKEMLRELNIYSYSSKEFEKL